MQTLPGFRDFLPADCARRNYLFDQWRRTAAGYGFVEWDGPILEPTALYQKKSGPEIVHQLFNFTDKGEREVAMRPELTPTLARVVAANDRQFKKPLKWFAIAQCFRYEKQQRGRLREHFQLNCDLIGEPGPAADAEMIALAVDVVRAFGFSANEFVVRVSDRAFWTDFLREQAVPEERWPEVLQIIDKSEREPRAKTAERLGQPLAEKVFAVIENPPAHPGLEQLRADLAARGLADYVAIDLGIVRGLAYYTGVVFEVFDRAGKLRAIAGGGRYDNLIHQLSDGAVNLPALGFAIGDVVLGDLIENTTGPCEQMKRALAQGGGTDLFLVVAKEERRADALRQLQDLRDAGFRADYALGATKVGKQFQLAEQAGARLALIYGDEWPQVGVKTLGTGAQELVAQEELLAHLTQSSSVSPRARD